MTIATSAIANEPALEDWSDKLTAPLPNSPGAPPPKPGEDHDAHRENLRAASQSDVDRAAWNKSDARKALDKLVAAKNAIEEILRKGRDAGDEVSQTLAGYAENRGAALRNAEKSVPSCIIMAGRQVESTRNPFRKNLNVLAACDTAKTALELLKSDADERDYPGAVQRILGDLAGAIAQFATKDDERADWSISPREGSRFSPEYIR